jgi:hypothetical protein
MTGFAASTDSIEISGTAGRGAGGAGAGCAHARHTKLTIISSDALYPLRMKHTLFALFFTAGALAQSPPAILSITPTTGPDSGGTEVVIAGNDLSTPVACLLPCPPRVGFGDIFVDAVQVSDHQLNVTTPAHAAGTVDVTVTIPGRNATVVANAFTFVAGPESGYERVLLPIYLSGVVPGAHGAQWATDLWIHNGGTASVAIADRVCPANQVCPPVIPLTLTLDAGRSLHNPTDFFQPNRNNPSQILYVSKQGAADVSLGLRVADVFRNTLNGGTDIPVIREGEFLTRTAQLHNVALDNQSFRILLRVYDVNYSEALFGIRIYPSAQEASQAIYGTTLTAKTPRLPPFRAEAAYAELDITPLLNLKLAWPQNARIEIHPMTPGSHYWAFLSLTNNQTQLVTLVTPQ